MIFTNFPTTFIKSKELFIKNTIDVVRIPAIELTSFDVSNNYIIFGASSGGIYIFKRDPCKFIKIIPSKEGSAYKILISPNEKNVAIGSSRGLIIILENFFVDLNLRYQVYTEHEGNIITAMKWHNDDLYCGDNTGKISVTTLMNILTKAIFQTPTASLMQLESGIVQLDLYSKYLLISTQTRSYLCDTEKEQYRQIGKKLREGSFGACFFNVPTTLNNTDPSHGSRGVFKSIKDDEPFSESVNNKDVKIYCARPGARLWEVSFDASVIVTHQFRNSLLQTPSKLLVIKEDADARLIITSFSDIKSLSENFNFLKIYPICNRFILTYDSDGMYVFDPVASTLVFWNPITNIRDIVVINSLIYIWQDDLKINIFSLAALEELIIKTLLEKQYLLCADLCLNYIEDVLKIIDLSKKIHLISILKTKLLECDLNAELEKMCPIFNKLEEYSNQKVVGIKLSNGIVVIENAHSQVEKNNYLPEFVLNINENTKNDENCDNDLLILYKQYKLNKTHKNVETTDVIKLFETIKLNDIFELFDRFLKYIDNLNGENAKAWCQQQFLRQISQKKPSFSQLEEKTWKFLVEAFIEINKSEGMSCICSFPLPKAHFQKPKYYEIGQIVFENSKSVDLYLKNIPYLYKFKINKIQTINDINENLPLVIQYSDSILIKQFLNKFTYDTWDEALKYFIKLKENKCLNCGINVDISGTFTWTHFGLLMMKSIEAENAIKLLKRYSQFIPNGQLDATFYQTCIFSTVANIPKESVSLMEKVIYNENDSTLQFQILMEKYLQKKYVKKTVSLPSEVPVKCLTTPKCTYCDLPLNTPIIDETKKLSCGHLFHKICLNHTNNLCKFCTVVL